MGNRQAGGISRREFLAAAGAAAATATTGPPAGAAAKSAEAEIAELVKKVPTRGEPPKAARVVIVRDTRVLDDAGRVRPDVLRAMVERALTALSGEDTAAAAWRRYFRKGDFVAMKYNELGGRAIVTRPELRRIATDALTGHVGVDAGKIVPIGRCTRYKGKYAGWGPEHVIHTFGYRTRFSDVFARHATAILSLPVVKTHQSGGVTCALKIHLGSVKNPYDFCGDNDWPRLWRNLPELSTLPEIKGKQRLIIADAIRPQYHKGPVHDPAWRFDHHRLIVSTDPVAVDAAAVKIVNDERRRRKLAPLTWPVRMVAFAEALGVGLADPKKVKTTEIDLSKG